MATTTNYGWTTPDDTALVKDGASAIRSLGTSIDTTTKNLNPSTTLGDIEYRSSTANTNTRLAIGSTGQVLTVAGGVPTWASPAGGGKVLQVVMGTSTTQTDIASSSYQSSGLSATITPSANTSKVLVLIAQYCYINDNDDQAGIGYRLLRDSTVVYTVDRGSNLGAAIFGQSDASVELYIVVNGNYLDSPATTSAITYSMEGKTSGTGEGASFQSNGQISTLILLEIGA